MGSSHSITSNAHTSTSPISKTAATTADTDVGGGSDGVEGGGQRRRHSSYETSPEVEEREARDRRRQGYGKGNEVGG